MDQTHERQKEMKNIHRHLYKHKFESRLDLEQ
jgi:hypothetical protein